MNNNRKLYIIIGVLCLLLLLPVHIFASEEMLVRLTINNGLAGETVNRVRTDHSGGTWIATNSGVNTFDGYRLHTFPLKGENGSPLEVYDMCETPDKHLYMATEAGVYCLSWGESRAVRVMPEVKRPLCMVALNEKALAVGSEQGLHIYDGKTVKHFDVDVSRQGLDNIVRQFARGDDGKLWFLGRFDLNCYDPATGKIRRYSLPDPYGRFTLTQFAYMGNGRFAIGTRGNGLFCYDIKTGRAEQVPGLGNIIMTVERSDDGDICVATDGAGAYRLKIEEGKLDIAEHFNTDGDAGHRLPSNGVYCYYRDRKGVNWFGFVRYGLAYSYHYGSLFEPFKVGDFSTEGMNIRTYCRNGKDVILCTQNGFYHVDMQTGMHRLFSTEAAGGGRIVNVVAAWEGRFYVGTFDGGLLVFDPRRQTLSKQTFSPLLNDVSIGDVKAGPDGRLWIGSGHGLFVVAPPSTPSSRRGEGDLSMGTVEHFTEQNSHIVGGLILSITFDRSGNAWLTGGNGCSLYSMRSHDIVETNFPKGFFNAMPWMRGALAHDGRIFFRTGPQTFYTNEGMTDFGQLELPVHFSDKWCRGFVDCGEGYYLLTSERGVCAFSYDMKDVLHFGYGEGLRGDFMNDMGLEPRLGNAGDSASPTEKVIWVATSQGLYFSDWKKVEAWRKASEQKVKLFGIRQGSDLLQLPDEYMVNEEHSLRLDWNFVSEPLQAVPTLPDYSKQTGRLYQWRLGGEKWHTVESGEVIDIRGLVMGKHRLEVRLAGAEGTASVYTITVLPSVWAIIELLLIVTAAVLFFLWLRYRKTTKVLLSERDEIEDALIECEELRAKSEEIATALEERIERKDEGLTDEEEKYQKVKIDEDECADIVQRMQSYIERERVYRNQDLKMSDLAKVLHISAPKLSQIFNLYMKESYYEFINRYRLDEFKHYITDGEYRRYTITALSEKCGFKKSNFFSTFRKVEGMTPAEYLKKNGINFK